MSDKRVDAILDDIGHYFGFLYDRGYTVRAAEYSAHPNGSWMVDLESATVTIHITSDREFILLELSRAGDNDPRRRITIERLIYAVSEGREVMRPYQGNLAWGRGRQLERLSKMLREHLDAMATYFEEDSQ